MLSSIGRGIRAFGQFWWDFIVGEDVTLAIAVVIGLGAVAWLHHATKIPAWWILPVIWALGVVYSLVRVARRR